MRARNTCAAGFSIRSSSRAHEAAGSIGEGENRMKRSVMRAQITGEAALRVCDGALSKARCARAGIAALDAALAAGFGGDRDASR